MAFIRLNIGRSGVCKPFCASRFLFRRHPARRSDSYPRFGDDVICGASVRSGLFKPAFVRAFLGELVQPAEQGLVVGVYTRRLFLLVVSDDCLMMSVTSQPSPAASFPAVLGSQVPRRMMVLMFWRASPLLSARSALVMP